MTTENINSITDVQSDVLVIDLFAAMSSIDTSQEAGLVLRDLMSNQEIANMARRLRIAVMLVCGCSYDEIGNSIGAAPATIAKVSRWLDVRGNGYRLVISRMGDAAKIMEIVRSDQPAGDPDARLKITRVKHEKYAECFWPVEVVGAIIKGVGSGSQKKKERCVKTSALRSAEVKHEEDNGS